MACGLGVVGGPFLAGIDDRGETTAIGFESVFRRIECAINEHRRSRSLS